MIKSCCLWCQHSIRVLVRALAVLLLSQLPADGLGKAAEMTQVCGPIASQVRSLEEAANSWLWLGPVFGLCSQASEWTNEWRCLSLPPSLWPWFLINEYINIVLKGAKSFDCILTMAVQVRKAKNTRTWKIRLSLIVSILSATKWHIYGFTKFLHCQISTWLQILYYVLLMRIAYQRHVLFDKTLHETPWDFLVQGRPS